MSPKSHGATRHQTIPAPPSVPNARLILFYFDDGAGRQMLEEGTHSVGRRTSATIALSNPTVSRDHAELVVSGGNVHVRDLGSHNGTRVNGTRLRPHELASLDENSVVEFGSVTVLVRPENAPPFTGNSPPSRPFANEDAFPPEESVTAIAPSLSKQSNLVVHDPIMVRLFASVDRVARSDMSVLITGETGVGKELVAERIHNSSMRASRRLVIVNCAAIPETLIESELFGYERGAFTGANARKEGLLVSANGGSLVLDEVGELPLQLQAKLLRVLEAGEVLPLGANRAQRIDVRFIASTNRDLQQCIVAGTFREDLFHRLAGMHIQIPPLRDRPQDVLALANYFADSFARQMGAPFAPPFTEDAAIKLTAHSWPGNARELRNVVGRALLLGTDVPIAEDALDLAPSRDRSSQDALPRRVRSEGERGPRTPLSPADILSALSTAGGNQAEAAKLVGVSRRTLINWMERWNLPRPRKRQKGRESDNE